MVLPRSAATSCYLRSSPILGGCSSRCPWQKLQLPIFPPQGSFTGRSLGETALPLFSCGILFLSPLTEVVLHGVGLGHLSHAWQLLIHKGMQTSEVATAEACWQKWYYDRKIGTVNLNNNKKSVLVEDLWPSMLVCQFIRGDICHDLMHHLPSILFPPILDLPLSLKSICLH